MARHIHRCRTRRRIVALALVAATFALAPAGTAPAGIVPAGAATIWVQSGGTADDGSGWQEALADQLQAEEGCTLAYFSQISVIQQNGRQVVVARAHCEDRRAFDVTRISPPDEAFTLRACATEDQRTC